MQAQASSNHNGDAYSASLGGGYNITIERWLVQPLAALRYIYLAEDSFRESGAGGVNLIVGDQSTESLESELGFRLARMFQTGIGTLIPEVRAAWNYNFDIDDRVITSAFEGASDTSFAIAGQDVKRHGATIGAGINLIQKNGLATSLKYNAELREDYSSHNLLGEIRYSF
jgi:outer membrane autotransporter protein